MFLIAIPRAALHVSRNMNHPMGHWTIQLEFCATGFFSIRSNRELHSQQKWELRQAEHSDGEGQPLCTTVDRFSVDVFHSSVLPQRHYRC